jgi:hypothetical protein
MMDDWPDRVKAARTPKQRLKFLETTVREAFRTARNAQGAMGELMAAIIIWDEQDREESK